jgi:hypothetical protein
MICVGRLWDVYNNFFYYLFLLLLLILRFSYFFSPKYSAPVCLVSYFGFLSFVSLSYNVVCSRASAARGGVL